MLLCMQLILSKWVVLSKGTRKTSCYSGTWLTVQKEEGNLFWKIKKEAQERKKEVGVTTVRISDVNCSPY